MPAAAAAAGFRISQFRHKALAGREYTTVIGAARRSAAALGKLHERAAAASRAAAAGECGGGKCHLNALYEGVPRWHTLLNGNTCDP